MTDTAPPPPPPWPNPHDRPAGFDRPLPPRPPTPSPAPIAPPPVLLDPAGAIAVDVACRACGYNLRGLRPAGRCPECGRPIEYSLSGARLCFANPAWLRTVARGVRHVRWGLTATPPLGLAAVSLSLAASLPASDTYVLPAHAAIAAPLVALLALLATTVGWWGAWRATTHDLPPGAQPGPPWSSTVTRAALQLFAIVPVLALLPILRGCLYHAVENAHIVCARLLLLPTLPVAAGGLLRYLAMLARRIPDERLATSLTGVGVAMVPLPVALLALFSALNPRGPGRELAGAAAIYLLVVYLFTLHFLRSAARALDDAAADAEELSGPDSAPPPAAPPTGEGTA